MYKLRKFIHFILRREEMKSLAEARKRLKIPSKDLRILREEKLIKLYKYVKHNSSYYSNVLNGISIDKIDDIDKIPILTKELLKKKFIKIICKKDKQFLKIDSTSGSTGEATKFGTDLRDHNSRSATLNRANEMNNSYRYLDKMIVFWGAERDLIDKKSIKNFYNSYIKKIKLVSTYHMTENDIKNNMILINKFKPKIIVGYASALSYMADFISNNNKVLKFKPQAIISAGEMLYDNQRQNIEASFNVPVFNRYGSREFAQIASECSAHDGLHYDADRLIIEVVDDEGKICPPNTIGNLLITDLNNYVFPMIRYEIGDIGSLSDSNNCSCGCTLPKLNKIEGRSFDVIKGANGNSVSGSFWTLTLRHQVEGVENFQIRQKSIDKLELRLKVTNAFNLEQKEKVINSIKKKLGKQMKIEINEVEKFEYSPTGKFKWIVSDLNSN